MNFLSIFGTIGCTTIGFLGNCFLSGSETSNNCISETVQMISDGEEFDLEELQSITDDQSIDQPVLDDLINILVECERNPMRIPALFYAIKIGSLEVVEMLIDRG
jgi:hypothetical protein